MDSLKEWFEKKDYGVGIALLGRYSKNKVLYQNLSRKQNHEKLEYELRKIAEREGDVPVQVEDVQQTTESHSDQVIVQMNADKAVQAANIDELPAEVKKLWHENQDAYKEIRSLHEKLKLMDNATDKDRYPLTERIAKLDDKIRANWQVIDNYDPAKEPAPLPVAAVIDHKRIQANRKYISTNLKKLSEGNALEKRVQDIIAELQLRYDELKAAGEDVAPETVTELTKHGIKC